VKKRRSLLASLNARQRYALLNPCLTVEAHADDRYLSTAKMGPSGVRMALSIDCTEEAAHAPGYGYPEGCPFWALSISIWHKVKVDDPNSDWIVHLTSQWDDDYKARARNTAERYLRHCGDPARTQGAQHRSYWAWRRPVSSREEIWLEEHFPDAPCFL